MKIAQHHETHLEQRLDGQLDGLVLRPCCLLGVVLLKKLAHGLAAAAGGVGLKPAIRTCSHTDSSSRTFHAEKMPEGSVWYKRGVPSWSKPAMIMDRPNGRRPLLCVYF